MQCQEGIWGRAVLGLLACRAVYTASCALRRCPSGPAAGMILYQSSLESCVVLSDCTDCDLATECLIGSVGGNAQTLKHQRLGSSRNIPIPRFGRVALQRQALNLLEWWSKSSPISVHPTQS